MGAGGTLRCRFSKSRTGKREVAEIAEPAVVRRASPKDATPARAARPADALTPLSDISATQWRALAERAIESERLLSARLGIGDQRFGARPWRRVCADWVERCR